MFASTIITADNFSKGLDGMANNLTQVSGTMEAFLKKNDAQSKRGLHKLLVDIPALINSISKTQQVV
jgi:hypothetical protein